MLPPLSFFEPGFMPTPYDKEEAANKVMPPEPRPVINMPTQLVNQDPEAPINPENLTAASKDVPIDQGVESDATGQKQIVKSIQNESDANQQAGIQMPIAPAAGGQKATIAGGHYFQPSGGEEVARNETQRQYGLLNRAQQDQAKIERLQADEEASAIKAQRIDLDKKMEEDEADRELHRMQAYQRLQELDNEAQQIAKTKIDQGRIFRNPVGVLGAILASVSSLFAKDPDSGSRVINQAIQRDIEVQQANLNTRMGSLKERRGLLDDYMRLMKNDEQARLLTEAQMKRAAGMKLQEIAARYRSPQIEAIARQRSAMLNIEANQIEQHVYRMHWREFGPVNAAVEKAKQAYKAPPSYAQQGNALGQQADDMMAGMNEQLQAGPAVGGGEHPEIPALDNPNARINLPPQEIKGTSGQAVAPSKGVTMPVSPHASKTEEAIVKGIKALPEQERDVARYYGPDFKNKLDALANAGQSGDRNYPGNVGKAISIERRRMMYNEAIAFMNAHIKEAQSNPEMVKAQALAHAMASVKKAVEDGGKESVEVNKKYVEYAEHQNIVSKLDYDTQAILNSFGYKHNDPTTHKQAVAKANAFIGAVNGYGWQKIGLAQEKGITMAKALNLDSTLFGPGDAAEIERALDYLRDFQHYELAEKKKLIGVRAGSVNNEGSTNQQEAKQVFSSFQDFHSLQHRVAQARSNMGIMEDAFTHMFSTPLGSLIYQANHQRYNAGVREGR